MEDKSVFFLSNIFNEKKAIGITKKIIIIRCVKNVIIP